MDNKNRFKLDNFDRQLLAHGAEFDDSKIKGIINKNTEENWALLVDYIKGDLSKRLEQVLLCINFDFMAPENYDNYVSTKQALVNLLEEKDGVIDALKREAARLLLKSIPMKKD